MENLLYLLELLYYYQSNYNCIGINRLSLLSFFSNSNTHPVALLVPVFLGHLSSFHFWNFVFLCDFLNRNDSSCGSVIGGSHIRLFKKAWFDFTSLGLQKQTNYVYTDTSQSTHSLFVFKKQKQKNPHQKWTAWLLGTETNLVVPCVLLKSSHTWVHSHAHIKRKMGSI